VSFAPDEDEGPTPRQLEDARRETVRVLEKASSLYAPFSCGATAECCQLSTTKREPWLWPTEWRVLEDRLQREGRELPPPREDGGCPFLDAEGMRCTVYTDRPFGCRTFFCHRRRGPAREPAEKVHALLDTLAAINIGLSADAKPKPILECWRDARAALSGLLP
jgi:Fe-S-cluster containining protein